MIKLTGELDPGKIVKYFLPPDQYIASVVPKGQLVLHHSAGWDNARGMFDSWKADKARVATAFGMVDDGTIYQAFDHNHWASHVGYFIRGVGGNDKAYELVRGTNNQNTNYQIEVRTIGIEVCNWGNLWFRDGKYHTWASSVQRPITIDEKKVVHYDTPFRGFNHYERYTDQEIESLWRWIRYYCKVSGIPAKFDGNFELSSNAILGVPGVYTHANYRADKSDMHPQKELIEMLKSI